jgi:antitoxin (DNA-binding transcriptional repressor) of toxin-antitoxin stability system
MKKYTYSEARKNLADLLEKAKKGEKILITRKDGSIFEIKALKTKRSPLDVKGININITKKEIVDLIKEVRKR